MDKVTGFLIMVACIIVIIAGSMWINSKFRVDCVDWWPFKDSKTCAITAK